MVQRHFSPEQQKVWRPAGQPALAWGKVFIWLDIFAINQHPGDCQRNDLQVRASQNRPMLIGLQLSLCVDQGSAYMV